MKDFFSDMFKLNAEQKPGKGNPKFVPTTSNQSYQISLMDHVLYDILFTSVTFSAVFCNVDCLPILTKSSFEIVSFSILSAVGLEWAFYQQSHFRLPIHHVSVPEQGSCISSNSEFSFVGFDSSSAVLLWLRSACQMVVVESEMIAAPALPPRRPPHVPVFVCGFLQQ